MHNKILKALLLSTATLGCVLAVGQAGAQGTQDRGIAADRYGYVMRQGKPDPYTDGANGIRNRDPYTDGAHGVRSRDPYTDGANSAAAGQSVAGLDRTGVSAPPAHGAASAEASV